MINLAAFGYIVGSLIVLIASVIEPGASSYWLILVGFLLTGLGWGAVEAATNPMVSALYPEDKTHRLNILHAWWPAGIVIGGLAGLAFEALGLPWQSNLALLILPAVLLGWLAFKPAFPVTERVAAGISHRDMYLEILRSPGFWVWFFCMMLTVSSELAPGQWVDLALSNVVGMQGIVLLIYVSAIMFIGRHFAGPIARRFSPVGLLWLSSAFAAAGLYSLSLADSPLPAFAAATLWAVGVCYMYPTMLACVAERYPKGGAWLMGLMGFAGGLAVQFVLPRMGAIFDAAKARAAGGVDALATLSGPELDEVIRYASIESFRSISIVPVLLLPIFGILWWRERGQRQPAQRRSSIESA
jgi:fucose permease